MLGIIIQTNSSIINYLLSSHTFFKLCNSLFRSICNVFRSIWYWNVINKYFLMNIHLSNEDIISILVNYIKMSNKYLSFVSDSSDDRIHTFYWQNRTYIYIYIYVNLLFTEKEKILCDDITMTILFNHIINT